MAKRKQEGQAGVVIPSLAEVKAELDTKLEAIAKGPAFRAAAKTSKRWEAAQADAFKVQQAYDQALAPYLNRELGPLSDEALYVNELICRRDKDIRKVYRRHGFRFAKQEPSEQSQEGTGTPASDSKQAGGGAAGQSDTPETNPNLIYQSDAAEFYNIPKSTLCKAAQKSPGTPGYLWSDTKGSRRFYRKSDLQNLARSRQKLRGV